MSNDNAFAYVRYVDTPWQKKMLIPIQIDMCCSQLSSFMCTVRSLLLSDDELGAPYQCMFCLQLTEEKKKSSVDEVSPGCFKKCLLECMLEFIMGH